MGSEAKAARTGGRLPAVAGPAPAQRRSVTLITTDGVAIEAAYEPHAGAADGSAQDVPVIVVAHGFTGSLDRPAVRRVARTFARHAAVVTFSFRGHGRSGGHSTVGDREVLDLAAAVHWARSLGHRRVATVGFSLGGSVALRHAALHRPLRSHAGDGPAAGPASGAEGTAAGAGANTHTDAVVAVSAAARWYYRGTPPMRRLHWVVTRPVGRLVGRYGLRVRIQGHGWETEPMPPVQAVPLIAPTPLLIVHGDRDPYFPLDHPRSLAAAADGAAELWIEPGLGHAENAVNDPLLERIAAWVTG